MTTLNIDARSEQYQVKRIYWSAIVAGALVMLVIVMLLNLLGLGIGLGTIDPATEQQPFSGLGIGALIWWVASNLVAIFIGGYLAGRLAGMPRTFSAVTHGFLSWCVFTLVSAYLLTTTVGSVLSTVGSVVSQTVSSLASAVNLDIKPGDQRDQNSNAINISNFSEKLNTSFALGSETDTEVSVKEIRSVVSDVFFTGGSLNQNVSRQQVFNTVKQNTDLSDQEAQEVTSSLMNRYQQVQTQIQQVNQTATKITDNASTAAIWTFVALVIGAIVATIHRWWNWKTQRTSSDSRSSRQSIVIDLSFY